jgi:Flp pilus assembly protein TadG
MRVMMKDQLSIQKRCHLFRLTKSERGSATVELAIVFPILLMLFAATAELGRLFSTYTTLAKATKVGARYLSTAKEAEDSNASVSGPNSPLQRRVKCLVVTGFSNIDGSGNCVDVNGTNRPTLVPNLTTANVLITLPPTSTLGPRYVKVEIQNYNFDKGIFNVANVTGSTNSTFYFSLQPSTRMRYMH